VFFFLAALFPQTLPSDVEMDAHKLEKILESMEVRPFLQNLEKFKEQPTFLKTIRGSSTNHAPVTFRPWQSRETVPVRNKQ
jgi:hypothetical protein